MASPLSFTPDTSKSGYVRKAIGPLTTSYIATVGDGRIGSVYSSGFATQTLWSPAMAFNISGIPSGATITLMTIDWQLDPVQPLNTSCPWDNDIYADGAGGIIGGSLTGNAATWSGSAGTFIQNYTWNASPPTTHTQTLNSAIHALITPGSSQQLDIVLPQKSFSGLDNGNRIWDFNGKVKTTLKIYYTVGGTPRRMTMGVGL